MLRTTVIGIGNAGGNVAKLVHEEAKFPAIAINTSNQDLKSVGDSIPVILFGDGKGIGKNRDDSKAELKKAIQAIVASDKMQAVLNDAELIFVVSSCGGGTGSGSALILATILSFSYPDANIIIVGIAPQLGEGFDSQANFTEYYKDLKKKAGEITYMMYDNEQYTNLPHKQMIDVVNHQICQHIRVLSGYYNNQTDLDSIDDRDLETILSYPGRLVVASAQEIKERDVETSDNIEEMIIDNLKASAIAEPQKDRRVEAFGVIADISDKIPFNPQVPLVRQYIGEPINTFKHISINMDKALPNEVYLILSGLSIIRNRKDRAVEVMKDIQKKQAAFEVDDDDDDDDDLDELKSYKTKRAPKKKKTANNPDEEGGTPTFNDIFKAFGA